MSGGVDVMRLFSRFSCLLPLSFPEQEQKKENNKTSTEIDCKKKKRRKHRTFFQFLQAFFF